MCNELAKRARRDEGDRGEERRRRQGAGGLRMQRCSSGGPQREGEGKKELDWSGTSQELLRLERVRIGSAAERLGCSAK